MFLIADYTEALELGVAKGKIYKGGSGTVEVIDSALIFKRLRDLLGSERLQNHRTEKHLGGYPQDGFGHLR